MTLDDALATSVGPRIQALQALLPPPHVNLLAIDPPDNDPSWASRLDRCGFPFLGEGGSRLVVALDEAWVAKVQLEHEEDSQANEREMEVWRALRREGLAHVMVPLLGCVGRVLIARRGTPFGDPSTLSEVRQGWSSAFASWPDTPALAISLRPALVKRAETIRDLVAELAQVQAIPGDTVDHRYLFNYGVIQDDGRSSVVLMDAGS